MVDAAKTTAYWRRNAGLVKSTLVVVVDELGQLVDEPGGGVGAARAREASGVEGVGGVGGGAGAAAGAAALAVLLGRADDERRRDRP